VENEVIAKKSAPATFDLLHINEFPCFLTSLFPFRIEGKNVLSAALGFYLEKELWARYDGLFLSGAQA